MKLFKISSLEKLKKNLLTLLCFLLLPPVAVFMMAAWGHFSQERAIEAAVNSYVLELAESVAYRLSVEPRQFENDYQSSFVWLDYSIFALGPSIPGWVAYVSEEGHIIMSSPGAEVITEIWHKDLPVGVPVRTEDCDERLYTLAVCPLQSGGCVVAAVSWDGLFGNIISVGRMWPMLIVFFTLGGLFSIRLLWLCLILPLKKLVSEIDGFSAGRKLSDKPDPNAVLELESLHSAMLRFAQAVKGRDELRNRYVRDVVRVQEAERMDMAREIHDGPLQDITALLQQIHMTAEDGVNGSERVKKVEQLARVAVRELRGLCDELSPPWVELGFSQALNELADRLYMNYDVRISVDVSGSFELGAERTLSLLRIFQEAVSNAVRHGKATEIYAGILEREGRLVFEIRDNGEGFDPKFDYRAMRLAGHRGLANMTERMFLMGGKFEVRSSKGNGTVIICTLPQNML